MASKKAIVSLSVIVMIVILAVLFVHSYLQPLPIFRAAIDVYATVENGYWIRDIATDLPKFVSNVRYSISNKGNANAFNVSVKIYFNGLIYSSYVLPLLKSSETHSSYFSVSTFYDSFSDVIIEASCYDSTNSFTLSVGSKLPRRWTIDSNILKLYITPKEANVVNLKNKILSGFAPIHWIAIRDWVGNNIRYVDDLTSHRNNEYWQLPKETIELRTGDCEDYAILLCSLLRADGWSPNDVYVVLGKNQNGEGHAWVRINLGILGWYSIEPQLNGWSTFIGDLLSLSGYEAICYFNDLQFHMVG